MATVLPCDMCGEEPALIMQTNVTNGDAVTIGANCQPIFLLTVVSELLDMMPADVAAQYAQAVTPIVDKLARFGDAQANATSIALDNAAEDHADREVIADGAAD